MNKKLLQNSAIYTIGDFISVAITGFLLLPFYTRVLSTSEFAEFNIIMSSVLIITYIVHFGIISTYSRIYFNKKDNYEKDVYTGQILILHVFIAILLILIMFIFEKQTKDFLIPSIINHEYYYFIIIVSILSFINAMYGVFLRFTEQAGKFLIFQLTTVVLYVIGIFTFKLLVPNTLDAILIASFVSTLIMWAISIYNLKFIVIFTNLLNIFKSTMYFSLPIFIGYILYFLLNKFNVLYLQHYESMEQIAFFSFALQVSSVLVILSGSIGKAIHPMIFRLEKEELLGQVDKLAMYYKLILTGTLLSFLLFTDFVYQILAPEAYSDSKTVFYILLGSVYIYNLRAIESLLFLYFHRPRYSLYVTAIGAFFVVLLSFIFVPQYGSIASAIAILFGSIAVYVSSKLLINRIIHKEFKSKQSVELI